MAHVIAALQTVVKVKLGLCFTDSKVALYWIQCESKEWKQFVHNRVTEIRQLVPAANWSHCPGRDNPADIPSRGVSPKELEMSLLWRHGPDWLRSFTSGGSEETTMPEECVEEMKVKCMSSHSLLISTDSSGIGIAIDCERFSKLQKLLRVTTYVKKFVLHFKAFAKSDRPHIDWTVTAVDMELAELDWIIDCQKCLTKEAQFELWKGQLQLFRDQENVWRCGGRLTKADIPYSMKYPILLSKQHHFAVLVTERAHERTGHSGVKDTLTEVRCKYWFVRGRQFVRKIVYRCLRCRKLEGQHYRAVPAPLLPESRVQEAIPFAYCGVDFAGPLYITAPEGSESNKVWICLFTCCVT